MTATNLCMSLPQVHLWSAQKRGDISVCIENTNCLLCFEEYRRGNKGLETSIKKRKAL